MTDRPRISTPLAWSQPFGSGSGRWNADVTHRGLDIEVTAASNAVRGGVCPCAPGECTQPGVPAITVYATARVPMMTTAAGSACWLASQEQPVHVDSAMRDARDRWRGRPLPLKVNGHEHHRRQLARVRRKH